MAKSPKTFADVFGQIAWLFTRSAKHRDHPISELERLALPAIMAKQFQIYYDKNRAVGVVLWASVSDTVAARLEKPGAVIDAHEWQSGKNKRVIELIAPFGSEKELLAEFERTHLKPQQTS